MPPSAGTEPAAPLQRLEFTAFVALCLFAGTLQLSIAAAQWLLTVTLACWLVIIVRGREGFDVPSFFWPLAAYAGYTLLSAAASLDPAASLADAREVLLFLVVPVVYRLARGRGANVVATVLISVGAVAAVIGIVQYGILEFDHLGQRPQGSMGHYMTFAGLLMLAITLAGARLLFGTTERLWAGLVLPALVAALALTLTRSAWVGACAGVGLLLVLRDRRLLAAAPVVAALLFAFAPASVTDRLYSAFDLNDPTNRDRFAMACVGARMIREQPLTGVGPDMVQEVYEDYRERYECGGVNAVNPHLHNVPLHIAAERGLPALALWLWFVVAAARDLIRNFRHSASRALAAAGLGALASTLAAGVFEYNFGDSEFLMLLLILLTLPAAARVGHTETVPASAGPA